MKVYLPLFLTAAVSLAACSTGPSSPNTASGTTPPSQSSSQQANQQPATSAPSDLELYTEKDFSILKPIGWSKETKVTLPSYKLLRSGVAFLPPKEFAQGTTFRAAMIYIERGYIPCSHFVEHKEVTINGTSYIRSTSSTVNDENARYTTTYALAHNKTCYSISLYHRRCTQGNACGEASRPFDPRPLGQMFERMVASFETK